MVSREIREFRQRQALSVNHGDSVPQILTTNSLVVLLALAMLNFPSGDPGSGVLLDLEVK